MKLGYIILYVDNVEASIAFYEQAFGIKSKFIHESGMYGELDTGETSLAFANAQAVDEDMIEIVPSLHNGDPKGSEIAFVSDDVDAAYRRAIDAGALSVLAPVQKPWGQRVAYVKDRDGFLVELCTAIA